VSHSSLRLHSLFTMECQTLILGKAWFSLATQAQVQEQTQAIGMIQVKTKFDTNTSTSKIIRTFLHFGKLFRCELIWIQYFHWPNITTCGKYPCVCVMPERCSVFTCCNANASISASTRKRKNFDPCACAFVKAVFTAK